MQSLLPREEEEAENQKYLISLKIYTLNLYRIQTIKLQMKFEEKIQV